MSWNTQENTQRGNSELYSRFDQRTGRFAVIEGQPGEAEAGTTRTFTRMWDSDNFEAKQPVPATGWVRGNLVKMSQPVVVLTSLGPMWDPSAPGTWHPYGA
ncbi:MAG: hypothetical protein ACREMY_00890 [bacterium]